MIGTDNNANDVADELLEELQDLEDSTETMEASLDQAEKQQQKLAETDSPNTIDAAALSLEAAKTSQQAASQSQNAAEAAIKLSYEQKTQVMELSDSNLSWRQTLRAASKELDSAKGKLTTMLIVGIIFSLLSTGIMGFLFYTMIKKQEMMKGDVLDIISTETTLFNKQMTIKIDQMTSLIESLSAEIHQQSLNMPPLSAMQNAIPADQMQPRAPAEVPQGMNNSEVIETALHQSHNSEPQAAEEKAVIETPKESKPESKPVEIREVVHKEIIENKVIVDDKAIKAQVQQLANTQQQQLEKIEGLIAKLVATRAQAPVITQVPSTAKVVTQPVEVTSMGLTESQVKKLNNISWAVHKQGKILKEIQAILKAKKPASSTKSTKKHDPMKGIQASLNDLNKQMKSLKTQQEHIQKEVSALKVETKKLAAKPDPYSYRAKELPVQ